MGRTTRFLTAGAATGLVLAATLTAATTTTADADGVTVTDPSGATATTTLTFSHAKKDLVTLTWSDDHNTPPDYQASVANPYGSLYDIDLTGYTCDETTCSWSGKAADVASGDRVRIWHYDEAFENQITVGEVDLLPADEQKPTITVKFKDRKVKAGQPILFKVKFSDNQTEFGWDPNECSPGGTDCWYPKWFPKMSLNKGKKWVRYTDFLFSQKPKQVRLWIKWPDEALNMSKIYKSPLLTWTRNR